MNAPVPMSEANGAASAAPTSLKSRPDEGAADYPAVICTLNARWRVIACREGMQWSVQRRHDRKGAERWDSHSFCVTRDGLIACVRDHAGYCDLAALQFLASLPDVIGGAR